MTRFNPHLFATNVTGFAVAIVEHTNCLAVIGGMVGIFSGFMLICINWRAWLNSEPVQAVLALFRRS